MRRHSSGRGPRSSRTARWLRAAARTTLRSGCPATAPASRPQRAASPYRDMRGRLYGKMAAPDQRSSGWPPGCSEVAGRSGAGRLGSVRNHTRRGPAPALPPPYGEMATPALPLRRAWLPRLPVAVSRSSPSERQPGQSAAGQGRWTQVRRAGACPVAGGLPWTPAGAEARVLGRAGRASP